MRVAIPIWVDRVSPVFDVAQHLLLVDIENGSEVARREERLDETDASQRAKHVAQLGVEVLICGAISWPLEALLCSAGVQVFPQTCGPVEDVIQAFVTGRITERAFLMPGCGGRRRLRERRGHGGPRVNR